MHAHPTLTELLLEAERILVFTGAGISTGSGIPDYRGPEGVWKTRRPVFYQEFMGSGDSRRRYWQQKSEDWEAFGAAAPNAVHEALSRLEGAGKLEMVVTQNIDGLHAAAGTSRERLVEMHGTNARAECQSCGEQSDAAPHYAEFTRSGVAPLCACGGYLKPATISFGQNLRAGDLERAFGAARAADLALALGSTLSVTPASTVPLSAAEQGTPYVIINRGPTEHDSLPQVTLRIEGEVGEVLVPAIDTALAGKAG